MKKYLTIPEAARVVGISRIAVYKRVKKGKIKALRIGRNYAIPKEAVKEILANSLKLQDKRGISSAVEKMIAGYGKTLESVE